MEDILNHQIKNVCCTAISIPLLVPIVLTGSNICKFNVNRQSIYIGLLLFLFSSDGTVMSFDRSKDALKPKPKGQRSKYKRSL